MLKQIFARLFTLFILVFCAVPAWGLTLKVMRPGDDTPLSIELHATKRTEHALVVKMADGTIYYADMRPVDESFHGGMFARIDGQVYQVGVAPSTFSVTTTSGTDSFSFTMSAAGTFTVDWGDGTVQEIVRDSTTEETYSHTYAAAGKYIIGFEGKATEYGTVGGWATGAISFASNLNVGGIRGSLGAIFSTIGDGSVAGQQPRFAYTFYHCSNMAGTIPENLFAGVHGQPAESMFLHLFDGCGSLTGSIPANLFAGIKGTTTLALFSELFFGCHGLTGSIPPDLFAGISGAPTTWLFNSAFYGCWRLTGSIPDKLFAGIKGAPAQGMFARTFTYCVNLTGSIPENLFGDISGAAKPIMFYHMFLDCSKLTGASAKINGRYLYEIWPEPVPISTTGESGKCYEGATGLSDYADIPAAWK